MSKPVFDYFSELEDPRVDRTKLHSLETILTISLCAIICGAEGWSDIACFGRSKEAWFKKFLDMDHGVPSEDTFQRVISSLCPETFETCFQRWSSALAGENKGVIAIDGKTLRGSHDHSNGKAAIHLVSAWASQNNMVFGQLATEAKSNEITAIPKLLKSLCLEGSVVTIDAMGCQKRIAETIIQAQGDYIFSLKGNHSTLHEEVKTYLDDAITTQQACLDVFDTTDGDHGRIEERRVWYSEDVSWLPDIDQWPGLSSIIAVEAHRMIGDKTTRERRYFISSSSGLSAEQMGSMIRQHWGIENKLHWSLDVSFGEDQCRIRKGYGAENMSRLRRIALNLLKQEKTLKKGIATKRLNAGWNEKYLAKILGF